MNQSTGLYISFEGTDGSGKTTLREMLQSWMKEEKLPFQYIPFKAIDTHPDIIEDTVFINPFIDDVKFFLYMAADSSREITQTLPTLEAGITVITDRGIDSLLAYSHLMNFQKDEAWYLEMVGKYYDFVIKPDLTFYCRLPIDVIMKRLGERGRLRGSYELKGSKKTWEKAALVFDQIAEREPDRVKIIDTTKSIDECFGKIVQEVQRKLGGERK